MSTLLNEIFGFNTSNPEHDAINHLHSASKHAAKAHELSKMGKTKESGQHFIKYAESMIKHHESLSKVHKNNKKLYDYHIKSVRDHKESAYNAKNRLKK